MSVLFVERRQNRLSCFSAWNSWAFFLPRCRSDQRCSRVIGLLACLVGLFLFGPGCGPAPFNKHLQKLRKATTTQFKASEIRAAALPLFSQNGIFTNPAPTQISSLPIFSDAPTNIDTGFPLGNTNILSFHIGSGFGHWGLVVCLQDQDSQQLTNDPWFKPRLTPWSDGIYFYSDFR